MRRPVRTLFGLAAGAGLLLVAAVGAQARDLRTASVHFEQNATDGDVEVVFKVKGRAEGLVKLTVTGPDGRIPIDFTAPDPTTLGIRQLEFESPEPPDVEGLKAAYPEGEYRFTATSASGETLTGASALSHALPPTATFDHPAEEAEGVSMPLEIRWTAPPGLASVILEIENDDLEVGFEASLPGDATSFRVPEGFLAAGTEYELAIGTVSEAGNISFVETSFTTAE
jgi:hypothetical protein